MVDKNFEKAVRLDEGKCIGCTSCIRRCPTAAIRVRNGKATIRKEFCIDCGECIRICDQHAKVATYDPVFMLKDFEYKVALPDPALYGQFNNLDDPNILLTALKKFGFDDVYEVGSAAEIVSQLTREYIKEHREEWPLISTACPSVTRLIRIRFPNLINHLLPLKSPVELGALIARRKAMKKTGLPSEKIGIFFISPCAAKVSSCRAPLTLDHCDVDVVLAIKDIYQRILPFMNDAALKPEDLAAAGRIGIGWGLSSGEASGLLTDNYLAADGIENIIKVLEDLEDQKLPKLQFIELNACSGGCVGGVLTVENPYVAQVKIKRLNRYLPITRTHGAAAGIGNWDHGIEFEPVFQLGKDRRESVMIMTKINKIYSMLPRIDCGACGAPSCHHMAIDIVMKDIKMNECIYLTKENQAKTIERLQKELETLEGRRVEDASEEEDRGGIQ